MQILNTIFCICFALGIAAAFSGCGRDGGDKTAAAKQPVAATPAPAPAPTAAAPATGGKLVFDSDRDSNREWKSYARDGLMAARISFKITQPDDPALIVLTSISGAPMGVNMQLDGVRGEVALEYKVLEAGPAAKFGIIAIPMSAMTDKGPIEVGAEAVEKRGESKNMGSKYRTRFIVPPEHNDGQWHAQTVSFDFTNLPEAKFVILAPRVNEFPGADTPGKIQFRHVKVTLR